MASCNKPDLPPPEPRHFAYPEFLSNDDREANLRDFEKLKKYKMEQTKNKRKFERKYKTVKSNHMIGTELQEHPITRFDTATLEYFCKKGSVTAQRLNDSLRHLDKAIEMLRDKDSDWQIVFQEFAECRRKSDAELWEEDFKMRKMFNVLFEIAYHKHITVGKSNVDCDARLCLAAYTVDLHKRITFLKESIQKYPEEVTFRILLCNTHALLSQHQETIDAANAALEVFPTNCLLLKSKVFACHYLERDKESLDTCFKLLQVASRDFLLLSEMYYMAASTLGRLNASCSQIEKYFYLGVQAEKNRLPFLRPVENHYKEQMEEWLQSLRPGDALVKAHSQIEDNEERARHELLNYYRVILIRKFREELMHLRQGMKMKPRNEPRIRKRKIPQNGEMQYLTLDEFVKKTTSSSKCSINFFVVEEPFLVKSVLRMIAEDEKGEVVKLFVQNADQELAKMFTFARQFSVSNPYVWRIEDADSDDEFEIWVGGEECVEFDEDESRSCRFCWKRDKGLKKCGKCKKCFYCCRDCQEMDWFILNHNYVCGV